MTDVTCTQVGDAAAEYALNILEPADRAAVAAHLIRCPACREEVAGMQLAADRLLDLVPGTEPPVGFEQRVLDRVGTGVGPIRRRLRVILTAAAAALIIAATAVGIGTATGSHGKAVLAEAELQQGSKEVGEVYLYPGRPDWIVMTVHDEAGPDRVTCMVADHQGAVSRLGTFLLTKGHGSWGAEYPAGNDVSAVYLLDSSGAVVATAHFD
jgi:Putative zinc-finger